MIQTIIANSLSLNPNQVDSIIASASFRYYHFQIPKHNGGVRDIYHPAQELKLLQRWITKKVLLRLPVSSAATAYEKHTNIRINAQRHAKSRYLLRLDFSDFFPSLSSGDIRQLLTVHSERISDIVNDERDIEAVAKVLCRFGRLTIGAPSSPCTSNRIMEDFDNHWNAIAAERAVTYTRYADDLFFSSSRPNLLSHFPNELTEYLQGRIGPRLQINVQKTVFSSMKARRTVTGLKLTPEHTVSLGRDFKRSLRTKIYLGIEQKLGPDEMARLKGLVAYAQDVEPELIIRLKAKFGDERFKQIFQ